MFIALRYFYIACCVIAVALSIFSSAYFRSYIENNIVKQGKEDLSIAITEQFILDVWNPNQNITAKLPCADNNCDYSIPFTYSLAQFFMTNVPGILSYNIYLADGLNVLDPKDDAKNHDSPIWQQYFNNARNGVVTSEIIIGHEFNDESYNIVRSFLPIIPDKSSPIKMKRIPAVLVITHNITPVWDNPDAIQMGGTIGIALLFIILFSTLFYTTFKTESILTKQYEATSELLTAKEIAEVESEEKSKFLANVSHELRTPLNAIIGFSEILKDEVMGPIENVQYKDYIKDIHTSGVHLLSLINDILDFSKADAGKLEVDLKPVDINKIMKTSLRLVAERAKKSDVTLISEIPKEHVVIRSDAKRLKQVLLNLLSNSVKFTPSGGKVNLLAWQNIAEQKMVIEVKDTGVGIAPKDISKVMSTFGQVENVLSKRYEGTGLGLPLAKKLIELMGGIMDIRSEINKGTTVTLTLPLDETHKTLEDAKQF